MTTRVRRTSLSGAVMVDANVVVYPWDTRDLAKAEQAAAVLRQLIECDVVVYSTQVVGEFYRSVTCRVPERLSLERAASTATTMALSHPVLSITPAVTFEALAGAARYQLSYWDAQLWATAKVYGVPVILTEDFENGRELEGVTFIDPFANGFDIEELVATLG